MRSMARRPYRPVHATLAERFTLLDGGLPPAATGLVSLEPLYAFPTAFAGGPSLFGQGAELRVERFEITSVNESR
jgi:hypothetical protein